jgi:hypothetical protein
MSADQALCHFCALFHTLTFSLICSVPSSGIWVITMCCLPIRKKALCLPIYHLVCCAVIFFIFSITTSYVFSGSLSFLYTVRKLFLTSVCVCVCVCVCAARLLSVILKCPLTSKRCTMCCRETDLLLVAYVMRRIKITIIAESQCGAFFLRIFINVSLWPCTGLNAVKEV